MWLKEILNKSSTPHPISLLKGLVKLPSEEAESVSCAAFSLLLGVRFGGYRVPKHAPQKDTPILIPGTCECHRMWPLASQDHKGSLQM